MKVGFVIGKFMPLHIGHEFLINFAKKYVDELHVIVDCLEGQTIDVKTRVEWIKETIPNIIVHGLTENSPQQPEDHPDFWNYWKNTIIDTIGKKPDVMVASMDYGNKLSEVIGCEFISVDTGRESFDISATRIRDDMNNYWHMISNVAGAHYISRFCIVGAESTGKSTLTKKLHKNFDSYPVVEFAKNYVINKKSPLVFEDMYNIALGQRNSEDVIALYAWNPLICDTDVLTTITWSQLLFGKVDERLYDLMHNEKYKHTFVMDIDTEWVEDAHRHVIDDADKIEVRKLFNDMLIKNLEKFNRKYTVVSGNWNDREDLVSEMIIPSTYCLNDQFTGYCGDGNLEKVKELINKDIIKIHHNRFNGLSSAIKNGHIDIVKFLIDHEKFIGMLEDRDYIDDLLNDAVVHNQLDIVKLMLTYDIFDTAEKRLYVLRRALDYGYASIAAVLLDDPKMVVSNPELVEDHLLLIALEDGKIHYFKGNLISEFFFERDARRYSDLSEEDKTIFNLRFC